MMSTQRRTPWILFKDYTETWSQTPNKKKKVQGVGQIDQSQRLFLCHIIIALTEHFINRNMFLLRGIFNHLV